MRRMLLVLSLMVAALLIVDLGPGALAQDATPAADEEGAGITYEPLSVTSGVTLPASADLVLVRITLEPGAALPSDVDDPTVSMVLVESGELTTALDAPITVTRTGSFGSGEEIEAGTEANLGVGDVAYFPANIGGEVRNDGTEPATGLVFLIAPPGVGEDEATPTT